MGGHTGAVGLPSKVQNPLSQTSQRLRQRLPGGNEPTRGGYPAVRILDAGCRKASPRAGLLPPVGGLWQRAWERAHVGKVLAGRRLVYFCSTTFGHTDANHGWSPRPAAEVQAGSWAAPSAQRGRGEGVTLPSRVSRIAAASDLVVPLLLETLGARVPLTVGARESPFTPVQTRLRH